MGFRKFGTSDEQTTSVDEQDQQGLSKSAMRRIADMKDDPDTHRWDDEGGNGSHKRDND